MTGELAFFGAFNPPPWAHVALARFALEQTNAHRVMFVPSKAAYIRREQGKDFAYTDAERLAMLRRIAESRPWMAVSDWEMRQDRQPRTYHTLCHFRQEGHAPALLMGSDKLPEMEKGWLYVREIAEEFGIVCLARGDDACGRMLREDPFLRALAPYIRVLATPEETRFVSSTAVRRQVARMREMEAELQECVPPEIIPLL